MNIISINRVLLFIIIFNINQVFGQHFNQIGLFVGYVGSYQKNTNFYKALGLTDISTCRLNTYSIGSNIAFKLYKDINTILQIENTKKGIQIRDHSLYMYRTGETFFKHNDLYINYATASLLINYSIIKYHIRPQALAGLRYNYLISDNSDKIAFFQKIYPIEINKNVISYIVGICIQFENLFLYPSLTAYYSQDINLTYSIDDREIKRDIKSNEIGLNLGFNFRLN
jgi:hypothetical protein